MTSQNNDMGVKSIFVSGFKSIRDEIKLEIKPLTILAGANSSGKSSLIQPLLLLKQTYESPTYPGIFELDRGNIKFSKFEQFFWKGYTKDSQIPFVFGVEFDEKNWLKQEYFLSDKDIRFGKKIFTINDKEYTISLESNRETLLKNIESYAPDYLEALNDFELEPEVVKKYSFLLTKLNIVEGDKKKLQNQKVVNLIYEFYAESKALRQIAYFLTEMIHLPGFRGIPLRTHKKRGLHINNLYPGVFQDYVASVIMLFQEEDVSKFATLEYYLDFVGLGNKISASSNNDAEIELQISRVPRSEKKEKDLVNIADVGFGVSQVLPVLVSLLVAKEGQVVYIEQPELHLHPNAQLKLAQPIVDAANRGVRVIIETHSELLLLGIQILVAEGHIEPSKIGLNWFELDDEGITRRTLAEFDEKGRFGDWPIDFSNITLDAQRKYFNASLIRKNKS